MTHPYGKRLADKGPRPLQKKEQSNMNASLNAEQRRELERLTGRSRELGIIGDQPRGNLIGRAVGHTTGGSGVLSANASCIRKCSCAVLHALALHWSSRNARPCSRPRPQLRPRSRRRSTASRTSISSAQSSWASNRTARRSIGPRSASRRAPCPPRPTCTFVLGASAGRCCRRSYCAPFSRIRPGLR